MKDSDKGSIWTKFNERHIKGPGCWEWTATKRHDGYGQMWIGAGGGETVGAHVLSYLFHKGPIPKKRVIMHSCDNPSCVNPEHLSIGTHLENLMQARDRGRWWSTKKMPLSKAASCITNTDSDTGADVND